MKWLNAESIDELKEYKTLKNLCDNITKDLENLFEGKKSRDKNIVKMITIRSNSWVGIFDKIKAFREVILDLEYKGSNTKEIAEVEPVKSDDIIKVNKVNINKGKAIDNYFSSLENEYIFYLLELDGKTRADKLKITKKCYTNKRSAKAWRDKIAKIIHPDKCVNFKANEALIKLNELYKEMIGYE